MALRDPNDKYRTSNLQFAGGVGGIAQPGPIEDYGAYQRRLGQQAPSAIPPTSVPVDTGPAVSVPTPIDSIPNGGFAGGGVLDVPAPTGAAVAGLQAAGPEASAAGMQLSAPGSLRQNLGRRNPPNEISALKVLTY